MKTIALAALTATTALATPAMAGPYVTGSAEFNGSEGEYQGREVLGRVGYDKEFGNITPYAEIGYGQNKPDEADGQNLWIFEAGADIALNDKLSVGGYYEHKKYENNDDPDWKINVGTKYRF